jgi:glycosyltransferase involved in cell wall biosynthesis
MTATRSSPSQSSAAPPEGAKATAEASPDSVSGALPGAAPGAYDRVAVLVPCYNEEPTVARVVHGFREALPGATIYVYDNNSKDRTAQCAREAGAVVVESTRQGKGNVVRHMFDTIDADLYVMTDGDDTYPPDAAPKLIELARAAGADMVVGTRLESHGHGAFRRFHQFGNRLISRLIATIFKVDVNDVLSGYRVFSRDFVRCVPLSSQGFEIETELTLQAAAKKFAIRETPIDYGERPEGSYSKLNTWGDGFLILKLIFLIFKDYKPLTFFGSLGIVTALGSMAAGLGPLVSFLRTGHFADVPMALLAAALAIISSILVAIGLLLHTIRNYHNENFELWRRVARRVDPSHDRDSLQRR